MQIGLFPFGQVVAICNHLRLFLGCDLKHEVLGKALSAKLLSERGINAVHTGTIPQPNPKAAYAAALPTPFHI